MTIDTQDRLWLHFTRMSGGAAEAPLIVRGEGAWVYDQNGKRYLDGLAGLFVSQVGHGRTELADAASEQARKLAYFPVWSYAHPGAIEQQDRRREDLESVVRKRGSAAGGHAIGFHREYRGRTARIAGDNPGKKRSNIRARITAREEPRRATAICWRRALFSALRRSSRAR